MSETERCVCPAIQSHGFLGKDQLQAEQRTWAVIWLCAAMMLAEIVGGVLFGSIALVADGLHMSTHAGALLLAALAYRYARRHVDDPRFAFGTGKLGDLAAFTSAVILAMISLLIAWEAVSRLLTPVPIHFAEAIPIAALGLAVNIVSAWLLSGGAHHHHGHAHDHAHDHRHDAPEAQDLVLGGARLALWIEEADGVPPRFRLRAEDGAVPDPARLTLETLRPDATRQVFSLVDRGGVLESVETIPEPHEFRVALRADDAAVQVAFTEHAHGHAATHRDNNMRAAITHVVADAAVSVLVIAGLLLARGFGWLWMDPLAGLVGAAVIASWSFTLVRDSGAVLLDMTPDRALAGAIRRSIEAAGGRIADLHLWRLGPGHLGAIVAVATDGPETAAYYRDRLAHFPALSHVTIEVQRRG